MTRSAPTPKSSAAPLPELSAVQRKLIRQLEQPLPESKALGQADCHGLGREALEGYFFGSKIRWDSSGRKWHFFREYEDNAWRLVIDVWSGPVLLIQKALPLDQVASLEGEKRVILLVEDMAQEVVGLSKAARAYQRGLDPESVADADE